MCYHELSSIMLSLYTRSVLSSLVLCVDWAQMDSLRMSLQPDVHGGCSQLRTQVGCETSMVYSHGWYLRLRTGSMLS